MKQIVGAVFVAANIKLLLYLMTAGPIWGWCGRGALLGLEKWTLCGDKEIVEFRFKMNTFYSFGNGKIPALSEEIRGHQYKEDEDSSLDAECKYAVRFIFTSLNKCIALFLQLHWIIIEDVKYFPFLASANYP